MAASGTPTPATADPRDSHSSIHHSWALTQKSARWPPRQGNLPRQPSMTPTPPAGDGLDHARDPSRQRPTLARPTTGSTRPRRLARQNRPDCSNPCDLPRCPESESTPSAQAPKGDSTSSTTVTMPFAPTPPSTPRIPRLATPDLEPLGDGMDLFCCCEGAMSPSTREYWQGRAKMDAQLEAALAHMRSYRLRREEDAEPKKPKRVL